MGTHLRLPRGSSYPQDKKRHSRTVRPLGKAPRPPGRGEETLQSSLLLDARAPPPSSDALERLPVLVNPLPYGSRSLPTGPPHQSITYTYNIFLRLSAAPQLPPCAVLSAETGNPSRKPFWDHSKPQASSSSTSPSHPDRFSAQSPPVVLSHFLPQAWRWAP